MWDDHRAALRVAGVGPVRERGFHRAARLRLRRSIGAPGHHRIREPQQRQVSQEVLPVLLGDVDDGAAVVGHARTADEVFGVGEERAPLRLQHVDHVQVFARGLDVRAVAGEEVHVGVAAVPALGVHVGPAVEAQLQLALAGLDLDFGSQRLVLESAGHVHQHPSRGKPALAATVDVGVGGLVQPQVAANVHVPGVVLGVQVGMVPVGLVGHALG